MSTIKEGEEIIVEEFRKKFGEEIYQQWITSLTYSALMKSWRKKQRNEHNY